MWPYGRRPCLQHTSSSMYHRTGSGTNPMCNGDCLLPGPYYSQTVANKYRCNMSTWCAPQPNYHFITDTHTSNTSTREMRNRAEKMRRDKLNAYISELATLVPMVSASAKRMDKTSILRLTATHLRIYHTLISRTSQNKDFNHVDQIALAQMIYEQLAGFLLILTSDGKIVFVSHTVEQILGHLQTDLMGQKIFTITSPEDHDRLRTHLNVGNEEDDWRRYFRLSLAKAGSRNETTTYVTFSVMGMVRPLSNVVDKRPSDPTPPSKICNELFVFFVRLYNPTPGVERMMDPNQEEYITRHLVDGRIISSDHRISLVAGYMIEEVSGQSAFNYMHKEDVRWTMIALRQMYDRGESQGWSCYRLQSRTGKFIYLRTSGYLEMTNGVLDSFVCVNTLVDEEEGNRLIKEMKDRYSVMINAPIVTMCDMGIPSVEDPAQLDLCIKHLITNIPASPAAESILSPSPSSPYENQDCYLTELPAEPYAIEKKTRAKRAVSEEECSQKRRIKRIALSDDLRDLPNSSSTYTEENLSMLHSSTMYMPNMSNGSHVQLES